MDYLQVPLYSAGFNYLFNWADGVQGNAILFGTLLDRKLAMSVTTFIGSLITQSTKHLIIPRLEVSSTSKKLVALAVPALLCGGSTYAVNTFLLTSNTPPMRDAIKSTASYAAGDYLYKAMSMKGGYRT